MKSRPFPKEIYIRRENEGQDDEFLLVDLAPEDFAEAKTKITAAVYRLDRVVVVSSKTTVSIRKRR